MEGERPREPQAAMSRTDLHACLRDRTPAGNGPVRPAEAVSRAVLSVRPRLRREVARIG
jgi:hypothetical protein